jgi:hypothetical protein
MARALARHPRFDRFAVDAGFFENAALSCKKTSFCFFACGFGAILPGDKPYLFARWGYIGVTLL